MSDNSYKLNKWKVLLDGIKLTCKTILYFGGVSTIPLTLIYLYRKLFKYEIIDNKLVNMEDAADYLCDNPNLLYHYRPVTPSVKQCVKSTLHIHNETFNIYSHLVASLVFIIAATKWLLRMYKEGKGCNFLWYDQSGMILFYIILGIITYSTSTIAHTFSSYSHRISKLLFQLDKLGIILQLGSGSFCAAMMRYHYRSIRRNLMAFGVFTVASLCAVSVFMDLPPQIAVLAFGGVIGVSVLPITSEMYRSSSQTDIKFKAELLKYTFSSLTALLAGGLSYAFRFPETLFNRNHPKINQLLSLFGHGHNIMHLCASTASYLGLKGLIMWNKHLRARRLSLLAATTAKIIT